jgi:hypothetical protein
VRRRRYVGIAVLVSVGVVATGCGSEPVSPLHFQTAGPLTTGATTPTTFAPPTRTTAPKRTLPTTRPTRATPTTPARRSPTAVPTSACFGAIEYDVDVSSATLDLTTSLCFATGARLHLRNIEPGVAKVEPMSLITPSYEAGIYSMRFIRPGTVVVSIPRTGTKTHVITVVIK